MRWRCVDLKVLIQRRFGIEYHERTIGKLLTRLSLLAHQPTPAALRSESRRPYRIQKKFPERLAEIVSTLPPATLIEIWFQDEMRLGQKNPHTRRWARRGSRPVAIQDLRTALAYLFGAICPERGTGAAIVMPRANTKAMQVHLDEIADAVSPGAQCCSTRPAGTPPNCGSPPTFPCCHCRRGRRS